MKRHATDMENMLAAGRGVEYQPHDAIADKIVYMLKRDVRLTDINRPISANEVVMRFDYDDERGIEICVRTISL